MSDDMMSGREVAALLGIPAGSWRMLVHRGGAPAPDGFGKSASGHVQQEWSRATIERFVRERNGRARRAG